MSKLTKPSAWLTVLPSAILAVALVLSNNGIDLAAMGGAMETILVLCGALVAGGVAAAKPAASEETASAEKDPTAPDTDSTPTEPDADTPN